MMLSPEKWLSKPRLMCGLMSGTSLDGVDAAIVEIDVLPNGRHRLNLRAFLTIPMPDKIREFIFDVAQGKSIPASEFSLMHTGISQLFAEAVRQVCEKAEVEAKNLDAIGSHGQTIWHSPSPQKFGDYSVASTLQIGDPAVLSQKFGVPVVSDFRSADVALGGQGAPLVPIFDFEFLRSETENVIALNIGGIANITLLPANSTEESVLAFDTGPGNMLIDVAVQKFYGKKFDKNGSIAEAGVAVPKLMSALVEEEFITRKPPKSTGREHFSSEYLENALLYNFYSWQPSEDAVRTLTEFTAWSIAQNIRLFGTTPAKIIASGGGIYNRCLMESLARELPECTIVTADALGIPSDAKEAICFAYLAYRTLGGLHGNIPSVTGAREKATLGVISYP